ncbi:MAG: tyrosine--tRNA ligase [Acidobacteriia bacterium]|nr:tyrosine--tRNA ligase [Terriglobia bacterium]
MKAVSDQQKSSFLEELRWRGFLEATTSEELDAFLNGEKRTMYVGFDPSADSLHLGSLIPVMALAHAQRHGHRPLVLVGGGTGLIGDPSGKATERVLLTAETTAENAVAIRVQLSRFFDLSSDDNGLLMNNADWLCSLNLLEFLRDIGKHFSVNEMIKRDSVRTRLEERDHGISYTEFSYMLLQAYDFLHLYRAVGCSIQMGGSDQWGNILSGRELIRRIDGGESEGITFPLLTTSTGKKFGKTEEGAVWLDAKRTSPYQMYQYWLQTADADVVRYLKLFTFLGQETIDALAVEVAERPNAREAQRVLAAECTSVVHGAEAVKAVEAASKILFGAWDAEPAADVVATLAREMPSTTIPRSELEAGIPVGDALVRTGLAESKSAARKLVDGGGVYLNNVRVTAEKKTVTAADIVWPDAMLVRAGKKNYHLVLVG